MRGLYNPHLPKEMHPNEMQKPKPALLHANRVYHKHWGRAVHRRLFPKLLLECGWPRQELSVEDLGSLHSRWHAMPSADSAAFRGDVAASIN